MKDLAQSVNKFMLANAPTISEANSMSYDLLVALATQLIFTVKTSREHAGYVMSKRYDNFYAHGVIEMIINDAIDQEKDNRLSVAARRRLAKRAQMLSQPRLLIA